MLKKFTIVAVGNAKMPSVLMGKTQVLSFDTRSCQSLTLSKSLMLSTPHHRLQEALTHLQQTVYHIVPSIDRVISIMLTTQHRIQTDVGGQVCKKKKLKTARRIKDLHSRLTDA